LISPYCVPGTLVFLHYSVSKICLGGGLPTLICNLHYICYITKNLIFGLKIWPKSPWFITFPIAWPSWGILCWVWVRHKGPWRVISHPQHCCKWKGHIGTMDHSQGAPSSKWYNFSKRLQPCSWIQSVFATCAALQSEGARLVPRAFAIQQVQVGSGGSYHLCL
jgi:hypothetical protein